MNRNNRLNLLCGVLLIGVLTLNQREILLPQELARISEYNEKAQLALENSLMLNQYTQEATRISMLSKDLSKIGVMSNKDKFNFLGYIGKTLKDSKVSVTNIGFINLSDYFGNAESTVEYDLLVENYLVTALKLNKSIAVRETTTPVKTPTSTVQQAVPANPTVAPVIPIDKAILIDVSGTGANLTMFITALEKINYKTFLVDFNTDKDVSSIRLVIDLR